MIILNKKVITIYTTILFMTLLLMAVVKPHIALAETFGDFEYELDNNDNASIIGYSENSSAVTIPSTVDGYPVTAINSLAFYNCTNITSVTIPSSVVRIDTDAFSGCNSLKAFNVDSNNLNYTSTDGVLYNKDKSILISYPSGNTNAAFKIPDKVKVISIAAFEKCSGLISITLPESITNIRDGAFSDCISLLNITIPSKVEKIGNYIFSGCSNLKSIQVNAANVNYKSENGVLYNYAKTTLLYYPVGKVESTFTIPKGVTSIDKYSISGNPHLTGITISSTVKELGYGAFSECSGLKSIVIPNTVTKMGYSLFSKCTNLEKVTMSEGVKSIDLYTFSGCTKLNNVIIPKSVTDISAYAFRRCSSLSSITIPSSVHNIGHYAFGDCINLKSVTLSNGVIGLGHVVFEGCTSLTSITIPSSISSLEPNIFYHCNNLKEINVNASNKYFSSLNGVLYNKAKTSLICYPDGKIGSTFEIPNSVTSIQQSAFETNTILTSIKIPVSVKEIGQKAFSDCTGLKSVTIPDGVSVIHSGAFSGCYSLTSVLLPKNLTSIEEKAFYDCTALISITIPKSLENIDYYVFSNCKNLKSIIVDSQNTIFSSNNGILYNKTKSVLLFYPNGKTETSFTIPNTVTTINSYSFDQCLKLTSISIPDSVQDITASFDRCTNLKNIEVDSSNIFYSSLKGVLYDKDFKILMCYPSGKTESSFSVPSSVKAIIENAFAQSLNLNNITLSDDLVYFDTDLFENCTNLQSININSANPNYSSDNGVLYNKAKTALLCYPVGKTEKSFTIPNGVKTIRDNAFHNSIYLSDIIMPNSLTTIMDTAFSGCNKLTVVTIPSSVVRFGGEIFADCTKLNTVIFKGNAPCLEEVDVDLSNSPFENNAVGLKIYYTKGKIGFTNPWYGANAFVLNVTPTNLKAASSGYNSIKTSWNAVAGATGYEVWRGATSTGTFVLAGTTSATSFNNTGLVIETIYYYKIRSYVLLGTTKSYSDFSTIVSTKPILATPTNLKATSSGYNCIKANWVSVAGVSGYEVWRGVTKAGNYSLAGTVIGTTSYNNTGLVTGTTYYYKVRAYRLIGATKVYGDFSTIISTKPTPAVPTNFKVARVSATSIKVSWNTVAGASGYEVYRSSSAAGTFTLTKTTTALNLLNNGLSKGKYYYYKVRAYKMVGKTKVYGNYTTVLSVKTY